MVRFAILLLIALFGLNASGAEQGSAGWVKVEQLRSGQAVRVLSSDQRTRAGRLVRTSASAIVLDASGIERRVERSEILRIQVKSRARSVLIGLGIGAAAGVGVGYAAGSRSELKSGELPAAVGLGAVLFAPAGAAIGALSPSWKTVYRAGPAASPPK